MESRLPRALLNPGKEKTRQNGRRIKEEDEEMFTLTASDIHGILFSSSIKRRHHGNISSAKEVQFIFLKSSQRMFRRSCISRSETQSQCRGTSHRRKNSGILERGKINMIQVTFCSKQLFEKKNEVDVSLRLPADAETMKRYLDAAGVRDMDDLRSSDFQHP